MYKKTEVCTCEPGFSLCVLLGKKDALDQVVSESLRSVPSSLQTDRRTFLCPLQDSSCMPSIHGFALNTQNLLMRTNKQTQCTAPGSELVYSSLYTSKSNNAILVIHHLTCLIRSGLLNKCSQKSSLICLFTIIFFLDHMEENTFRFSYISI